MKYRYEAALPARICPAPQRSVGRVPVRYSGLAVAAARPLGTWSFTEVPEAAEACAVEGEEAPAEAAVAGA
ncbi:hypothetical protein AB0395_12925 [Streptosporangium sp. NPDC051023]|uniref:hypothetical protein n=1 Tax=Streptosporangium sp. NPDC051023 TaxID=3155410 RepID=UPI00344C8B7C